jgi:hypothetical protein
VTVVFDWLAVVPTVEERPSPSVTMIEPASVASGHVTHGVGELAVWIAQQNVHMRRHQAVCGKLKVVPPDRLAEDPYESNRFGFEREQVLAPDGVHGDVSEPLRVVDTGRSRHGRDTTSEGPDPV